MVPRGTGAGGRGGEWVPRGMGGHMEPWMGAQRARRERWVHKEVGGCMDRWMDRAPGPSCPHQRGAPPPPSPMQWVPWVLSQKPGWQRQV